MLGTYSGFPENVQRTVFFSSAVSGQRLQRTLVEAFQKLNKETLFLEDLASPSIPNCKVVFELGIAEDQDFNYLNDEETKRAIEEIRKETLRTMDFLCVLQYHRMQNGRKTTLRSDFYMLRFVFGRKSIEMRVFHEKGPMHISPREVADSVTGRINTTFSKRVLRIVEDP